MIRIKTCSTIVLFVAISTVAFCQDYNVVDGLKYKIYNPHQGPKPRIGDKAMCDWLFYGDNDSLVFNSIESHKIIPIPIQKSQFKGDLMEGIQLLSVGDSAVFFVNEDSVAKLTGSKSHSKPGSTLKYIIVLRSIFSDAEQQKIDDDLISDYIRKNKIEGMHRTADGLYYKIIKKGTGEIPKSGDTVVVHYTGSLLNGNVFDSDNGNTFKFKLGVPPGEIGSVIRGWEEAFTLLDKGAKAQFIIPSKLAYGEKSIPGKIPAFSTLLFDVEVVDFK